MLVYPSANVIVPLATIRRQRRLPPDVTSVEVTVTENQKVDADTQIMRGARSSSYRIVSMLRPLGVKRADQIDPGWINVEEGEVALAGQSLAERGKGRRAPRVVAPVDCIVARIEPDRFILQVNPEPVILNAIMPGTVTAIRGGMVQIQSVGALIQCAWGNGHTAYGFFKEEPEGGLATLADETLLTTYRNQILLTRKPLTAQSLDIIRQQEVAGLIGPSMPSSLRAKALQMPIPVILTEGFGTQQMSEIVYNLLKNNFGRQAAVDALEPTRWSSDRPEIFIQLAGTGIPTPLVDQPLAIGMMVRLARAPYANLAGRVKRIVDTPEVIENGLRMAGAEVQLPNGQTVFAPFANIEILGRAPDGKS